MIAQAVAEAVGGVDTTAVRDVVLGAGGTGALLWWALRSLIRRELERLDRFEKLLTATREDVATIKGQLARGTPA